MGWVGELAEESAKEFSMAREWQRLIKIKTNQHPVDDLDEAKRVLICLEHLTTFFSEEDAGNAPPDDFWFGYATILEYVEDNIIRAIEKLDKYKKEQKISG